MRRRRGSGAYGDSEDGDGGAEVVAVVLVERGGLALDGHHVDRGLGAEGKQLHVG